MLDCDAAFNDRVIEMALGGRRPLPADRERRRFPRRIYHGWLSYVRLAGPAGRGVPIMMRGLDIGPGGIGVACGVLLEPGEGGGLLMARSSGEPVMVGATVAFCRHRGELDYHVGLRLVPRPMCVGLDDFRDAAGRLPQLGTTAAV